MKRIVQPTTRKVYASPQQQQQDVTMRKINNMISSGSVSVNTPTPPRILKSSTIARHTHSPQTASSLLNVSAHNQQMKCYACDEMVGTQGSLFMETVTQWTQTKLPNKIGHVIGDAFMVIVRADDMVCKRCITTLNQIDRLEMDLDRLKSAMMTLISSKYSLNNDDDHHRPPAAKMQKLNSGQPYDSSNDQDEAVPNTTAATKTTTVTRKVVVNSSSTGSDVPPPLVRSSATSATLKAATTPISRSTPLKIYKCISCEFTTSDLKQFTPHYTVCPGSTGENSVNNSSTAAAPATTPTASTNNVNSNNSVGTTSTTITSTPLAASRLGMRRTVMAAGNQVVTSTAASATNVVSPASDHNKLFSCTICAFKVRDKTAFDEHMRKHIKVKPFKCRICSARFETRETASKHARTHQTEYYKCGTCAMAFRERDLLLKHFEVHEKEGNSQPQQQIVVKATSASIQQQPAAVPQQTTQKLLQETIDEALRGDTADGIDAKSIHFFSCNICSLTFIQETYYNQHMETHKREGAAGSVAAAAAAVPGKRAVPQKILPNAKQQVSAGRQQQIRATAVATAASQRNAQNNSGSGQTLMRPEMDLESIFEKMHSEKTETEAAEFNMSASQEAQEEQNVSTGIDMPVLDQGGGGEDVHEEVAAPSGPPVSMPSLDDDGDATAAATVQQQQEQDAGEDPTTGANNAAAAGNTSAEGEVPMEIEDMQNAIEGSEQLKFIYNENGQLLQLDDNHILTDGDGNQIIVQGADSEHLQQLLQSVAGLEGGTIQMISGENNQMILVQQGDGESQLIDASLLNAADGHQIVIQQQQEGDGEANADGEMSVDGQSQSSEASHLAVHHHQQQEEQQHHHEEEVQQQQQQQLGDESSQDEQQMQEHHQGGGEEGGQHHQSQEEVAMSDDNSQASEVHHQQHQDEEEHEHHEAVTAEAMTDASQDSQAASEGMMMTGAQAAAGDGLVVGKEEEDDDEEDAKESSSSSMMNNNNNNKNNNIEVMKKMKIMKKGGGEATADDETKGGTGGVGSVSTSIKSEEKISAASQAEYGFF